MRGTRRQGCLLYTSIVGKVHLVGALDGGQLIQHGGIVGKFLELLQFGSILLEAGADGIFQQLGQAGVCLLYTSIMPVKDTNVAFNDW